MIWRLLLGLYVAVLLVILAPVLLASVTGDDMYWLLEKGPAAQGSWWRAFWEPLSGAFTFSGNSARTIPLTAGERQVLALITMRLATSFTIPPFLVWALVKVGLLALSVLAVHLFLREIRFRDRFGQIRGLSRGTVVFITMAFPLVVAVGSKAQTVATLNGWNVYPTLTYGPLPVLLLLAVAALRAARLCEKDYRFWAVPAGVAMAAIAVVINFSYEMLAIAIPLLVLLVMTRPGPDTGALWCRWRSRLTVVLSLGSTYTVVFAWLRWELSQFPCRQSGSCYSGTAVEFRRATLWTNLLGALPGHTSDFVANEARSSGLPFPGISWASLGLGLVAVAVLGALWACWRARHAASESEVSVSSDGRGLLVVIVTGVVIGLGVTVITGLSSRAVQLLQSPVVAYRSSVAVWSALALTGLALVRMFMVRRSRVLGFASGAALALLVVVCVAVFFPRNVMSAQVNRTTPSTVFGDFLHEEVARGDLSLAGDHRRCSTLERRVATVTASAPAGVTFTRTLKDAYKSFRFYHHAPFCSARIGVEP